LFKPESTAILLVRLISADLHGLMAAATVVATGGLVCFPTDTVYGVGCDPLNTSAVEKVIRAKGGRIKAMPVLVKDLEGACTLAHISDGGRKLAVKFWPGPLTIVQHAKEKVPKVLAPNRTVGLRSPNHAICLELLRLCSGCLVGTSANITGHPPAISAEEAVNVFGDSVDLVLDAGRSPLGVASTVVDLTKNRLLILREGPIGKEEILRCLRRSRPR
jgi:L-threonylcarbamoyladenylate synthase